MITLIVIIVIITAASSSVLVLLVEPGRSKEIYSYLIFFIYNDLDQLQSRHSRRISPLETSPWTSLLCRMTSGNLEEKD